MAFPTEPFLTQFGAITHNYASVEFGVRATIAGMLGIHLWDALVLSEPYTSLSLRNVAKSIAKESPLTPDQIEEFVHILGEFGSCSALRNSIAHNRWNVGSRPGSIKPIGMDIRSGSGKSIGFDDEEQDYILDDFRACAAKLEKLNRRIVRFHRDSGLMAVIERKQETTSASIEEPEGNSNNDS